MKISNIKSVTLVLIALLAVVPFTKSVRAENESGSGGSANVNVEVSGDHGDTNDDNQKEHGSLNLGSGIKSLFRGDTESKDNEDSQGGRTQEVDQEDSQKESLHNRALIKLEIGGEKERGMSKKDIVEHRYDWALQSLNDHYTRLSLLISRLGSAGFDMTASSSALVQAQAKITIASTKIAELKAYVSTTVGASTTTPATATPRLTADQTAKIRSLASAAKTAVIDAHKALAAAHQAIMVALGIDTTIHPGMLRTNDGSQPGVQYNADGSVKIQNQ